MKVIFIAVVLLLVFALPAHGLNSCFQDAGLPSLELVNNQASLPFLAIGADGKLYVAGKLSTTGQWLVYNSQGNTWNRNFLPLEGVKSFEAHPDAVRSGYLFAGNDSGIYAVSSDFGQTWTVKNAGTVYKFYDAAQHTLDVKRIMFTDGQGGLHTFDMTDLGLRSVEQGVAMQSKVLSIYGYNVFIADQAGKLARLRLDSSSANPSTTVPAGVSALAAVYNWTVFYGTSNGEFGYWDGVSVRPIPTGPTALPPVIELVNYSSGVVFLTSTANAGKVLGFYNGSAINYVAVNSTSINADFYPVRAMVNPLDGKLYLLTVLSTTWRVLTLNQSCLQSFSAVSGASGGSAAPVGNRPPQINSLSNMSDNLTHLGQPAVGYIWAFVTDPDGNSLAYNWTKVSGPELNYSRWGNTGLFVNITQAGIYLFMVNITDNGVPPLSTVGYMRYEVVGELPGWQNASTQSSASGAGGQGIAGGQGGSQTSGQASGSASDSSTAGDSASGDSAEGSTNEDSSSTADGDSGDASDSGGGSSTSGGSGSGGAGTSGEAGAAEGVNACTDNAECEINQKCEGEQCVALTCAAGEVIIDHSCAPAYLPVQCGSSNYTGTGVCCDNRWLPDESRCPSGGVPSSSRSTNLGVAGGAGSAGSPFASIQKIASDNLPVIAGGGVVLLLIIGVLAYFFALKKKPPSIETQAQAAVEEEAKESTAEKEEPEKREDPKPENKQSGPPT